MKCVISFNHVHGVTPFLSTQSKIASSRRLDNSGPFFARHTQDTKGILMTLTLSLTKGLRLRSAIEEKLKAFDVKATVNLDVDSKRVQEDPKSVIEDAAQGLSERLETFYRLSKLLSTVRTSIAKANVDNGVDAILAEQGDIDRRIAKLKQLVSAPRVTIDSVQSKVERKLQSLKTPQQSSPYYPARQSGESETLSFNTVTDAVAVALEAKLVELRRTKAELEDNRAIANARTEIEIGDDDHALLVELAIV
jgi:hypothetical protein